MTPREPRRPTAPPPHGSAAVQLAAQEAKALARRHDLKGVREALDRGRALLDRLPAAARPDHHFVVDPERRSLPSLLMVAGELDMELQRRFPGEPATAEFREALWSIVRG